MKLIRHFSLYAFVGVLNAGINFFIMPILSHYLLPADYGILSILNTYVTILIPIVSLTANSMLSVDYFRDVDRNNFASRFVSIQILPVLMAIVFAIIVWQGYDKFAKALEIDKIGIGWSYIMVAITFLTIYADFFFTFLIIQKKASIFTIFSASKLVLEIGLTLLFVVHYRWNWQGRIYSWLITTSAFFIISHIYFYKQGFYSGRIYLRYMREGISFGAPLILHSVAKFVINQSDRLFIAKMVSLEAAGIYNIGYTVGMIVMVLINAFSNYYAPFLMERLAAIDDTKKVEIVRLGYLYFLGCLCTLVVMLLITPLLFQYLIDPHYSKASAYVFWVALGYCFWGGYMLFSGFFFYFKKNRIFGHLSIFNIVSNLILNFILIRKFGAIGATYATALSFFLLFVIIAYKANRLVKLPWLKELRLILLLNRTR